MGNTFEELKDEYETKFASLIVKSAKADAVDAILDKIVARKTTYKAIQAEVGMPWQTIGVIHSLESDLNFSTHLHNGDPLTTRTIHVPVGRPKKGSPPFTFAESAIDALTQMKFAGLPDWSLARTLFRLEKYNGMGYRSRGVPTPYLWSFSNHYVKGKFTEQIVDGKPKSKFDPNLVSKQCGAAVLLRRMVERKIIAFDTFPRPLDVFLFGNKTGIGAFELKGDLWIAARKLSYAIPGLRVDSVSRDPFTISMSFSDGTFQPHHDFPGRLFNGEGHVNASDLVRQMMHWRLDYDPTKIPAALMIHRP